MHEMLESNQIEIEYFGFFIDINYKLYTHKNCFIFFYILGIFILNK